MTRLLGGVARFMRRPDHHRLSWIHLAWVAWVAWVLFNVIAFWWWELRLSQITHWTFPLYLFVIAYASMFFLQAALLFPNDIEGYGDYFIAQRPWFFGIFAVSEVMDVVDTLIKGAEHLRSLGPEYLVRNAVFLALCLVAARTRNLTFHRLFAGGALVYEVIYICRQYFSLL